MLIPLVNQSLSRPICAWSSLSLLIVPVDGNENKNGQRCLFLSDAMEENQCGRNVESWSSARFAWWNSSSDLQGTDDGRCSVLSCRCSSTTAWPRPWFSLHSSPWSDWSIDDQITLQWSVPNSWRSAVTPRCQDAPSSSLPSPSNDCGIGFNQRKHRCWHLSSAVLPLTSTFPRGISSTLFDRYRRWSSPLPVKRKLSSLSISPFQMIWSSVPCANRSHIFVLTWNSSKMSRTDFNRRHWLWFSPHVQNYSNWNSSSTSGTFLGEEFFLLLPQRLPICHVDPLNINGRWICWLPPSARWTVRISFDADHPCQWCLSSCDGHRQQGKSNQSIFSMLIFLPFLESTAEVEVFLVNLVWPDPSVPETVTGQIFSPWPALMTCPASSTCPERPARSCPVKKLAIKPCPTGQGRVPGRASANPVISSSSYARTTTWSWFSYLTASFNFCSNVNVYLYQFWKFSLRRITSHTNIEEKNRVGDKNLVTWAHFLNRMHK